MIDRFSGTEADYAGYVALKRRVWPHEVVTEASQRDADARRDTSQFHERLLIREGGGTIAAADVHSLPFSADVHRFGFMVIVDQPARRRGIGTALYRHIVDDLGLGRVAGWEAAAWEGDPSGSAWLRHLGFDLVSTHRMSELSLDTVDTSTFGQVIDSVRSTGVALRSFSEFLATSADAAEELYQLAIELSRDVPWYQDVAKPPLEVWRKEFIDSDLILTDASTVAVLDGHAIGQSALMKDPHDPSILRTGLTGVRTGYRRRRIATAMKMRAIEQARTRPGGDGGLRIVTGNASDNPMLGLNRGLGFEMQPAWLVFARGA